MARIKHTCPICSTAGSATVRESPDSTRESLSFVCQTCGARSESDGEGLPQDLRAEIPRQEGRWNLEVRSGGGDLRGLAVALRGAFGLSVPASIEAAKRAIGGEPFDGTESEMRRLETTLRSAGAETRVVRVEDTAAGH